MSPNLNLMQRLPWWLALIIEAALLLWTGLGMMTLGIIASVFLRQADNILGWVIGLVVLWSAGGCCYLMFDMVASMGGIIRRRRKARSSVKGGV